MSPKETQTKPKTKSKANQTKLTKQKNVKKHKPNKNQTKNAKAHKTPQTTSQILPGKGDKLLKVSHWEEEWVWVSSSFRASCIPLQEAEPVLASNSYNCRRFFLLAICGHSAASRSHFHLWKVKCQLAPIPRREKPQVQIVLFENTVEAP